MDFNKAIMKVSRHKIILTDIDNSNDVDLVISFGISTGTDHFVMKEKKKEKDDDDDDESKPFYKNKSTDKDDDDD